MEHISSWWNFRSTQLPQVVAWLRPPLRCSTAMPGWKIGRLPWALEATSWAVADRVLLGDTSIDGKWYIYIYIYLILYIYLIWMACNGLRWFCDTSIDPTDPPIDAAFSWDKNNPRRSSGTPGLAFQAGWSHPKKLWCCQREQRGCEGSPGVQQRLLGAPSPRCFFPGGCPQKRWCIPKSTVMV